MHIFLNLLVRSKSLNSFLDDGEDVCEGFAGAVVGEGGEGGKKGGEEMRKGRMVKKEMKECYNVISKII